MLQTNKGNLASQRLLTKSKGWMMEIGVSTTIISKGCNSEGMKVKVKVGGMGLKVRVLEGWVDRKVKV